MDQKAIVRSGYDAIADAYLASRAGDGEDVRLLGDLMSRLPRGARVLDLGCGAGAPVARLLSERFAVTGVDFSESQIARARERAPRATFVCRDMTTLAAPDFPDGAFDAVVSLYAIIHVPREEHAALLANIHRMLVPGGLALLSMGAGESDGDIEDNWLGAGAPMSWSHYGRETNLRLLAEAGFTIVWERLVVEADEFGGGAHLFALVERVPRAAC